MADDSFVPLLGGFDAEDAAQVEEQRAAKLAREVRKAERTREVTRLSVLEPLWFADARHLAEVAGAWEDRKLDRQLAGDSVDNVEDGDDEEVVEEQSQGECDDDARGVRTERLRRVARRRKARRSRELKAQRELERQRALFHYSSGRYEQAIETCMSSYAAFCGGQESMNIASQIQLLDLTARALLCARRTQEAVDAAVRLLDLRPTDCDCWRLLTRVLRQLLAEADGVVDEELDDPRRVLFYAAAETVRQGIHNPQSYVMLAELLLEDGVVGVNADCAPLAWLCAHYARYLVSSEEHYRMSITPRSRPTLVDSFERATALVARLDEALELGGLAYVEQVRAVMQRLRFELRDGEQLTEVMAVDLDEEALAQHEAVLALRPRHAPNHKELDNRVWELLKAASRGFELRLFLAGRLRHFIYTRARGEVDDSGVRVPEAAQGVGVEEEAGGGEFNPYVL